MPQTLDIYIEKAGLTSKDKLAEALLERYGNLDWHVKARSLAAKIGLINKGDTGWWQKRPTLAEALAEFLEVPLEDLGIHPKETGDLLRFPEFPELPPLDLARELPCDLGRPVSLSDDPSCEEANLWLGQGEQTTMVRQPASGVHWLHFPPGRGVDLFWAQLLRQGKYETRRAHTIQVARESLRRPRHLILRIDADGGDADLHTLASMHKDMALLIVAPHAAPLRPNPGPINTLYLWERHNGPLDARRELDLTAAPFEQMRTFEWQLHPDWIERLLMWMERRLAAHQVDSLFTAEDISQWLDNFSYVRQHIEGPGDLLHLSSLLHRTAPRSWPNNKTKDAGRTLLRTLLRTTESAETALKQLCLAAWNDAEAPWGTPTPLGRWEAIADAQAGIPPEKLKALIEAEDREKREKIASQLRRSRSRIDLTALTKTRLLAPEQGEAYSLRPRFMAWLLARDYVIDSMTKGPLESWALNCFDPSRRLVVDAALDALTPDDLIGIAGKLPESLSGDAVGIAAAEALFYAIGRIKEEKEKLKTDLLAIAPRLLNCLDGDNAPDLPEPWSREIREEAAQLEWIATCWAWSLLPPPEELPERIQNSWLFPGWAIDLDSAKDWALVETLIDDKASLTDASIQPLLQRAEELVERLAQPPATPPAPLHPFLIAAGAKGRWPIEPDWWNGTFDIDWQEGRLSQLVEGIPEELLPRLLGSLIDHVAIAFQTKSSSYMRFVFSPLRRAILRKLPSGTLGTAFTNEQIRILISTPESLPPKLRSEVLELLRSSSSHNASMIAKLINLSTEADTLALLSWLETDHWKVAAQRIWLLTPHQAKSIVSNTKEDEPQRARALLLTCPDLSYSLPLIRENCTIFDHNELKTWVRRLLPYAGIHSRELMDVLNRHKQETIKS